MAMIASCACGWRSPSEPMGWPSPGKNTSGLAASPRRSKPFWPTLGSEGWGRLSAGAGAKGPRWYDWTWRQLAAPPQPQWGRWLLVRRSLSGPTELTAYVGFAPRATAMNTVVPVAGSRWTIAQCFEEAQGEVGLDQYEVRSGTGWYRHITLAMGAYALLAVLRIAHLPRETPQKTRPQPTPSSLGAFKTARGLACR